MHLKKTCSNVSSPKKKSRVIKTTQIDASAKASNFIIHLHLPNFDCSIKWKGFKGKEFLHIHVHNEVENQVHINLKQQEIVEVCTTQIHKVSKVLVFTYASLMSCCCNIIVKDAPIWSLDQSSNEFMLPSCVDMQILLKIYKLQNLEEH